MDISLADRLEHGNLTIREACLLADASRSKFYEDLKEGRVAIRKLGAKSVVAGPIAKRYIAGQPIDDLLDSPPATPKAAA
jgi:hypothetical protein